MAQARAELNETEGRRGLSPALRVLGLLATVAALGWALWSYGDDLTLWAKETQRALQTELARGVRAVRSGETAAWGALMGTCFLYGFAHAVGPGHGKLLIGGAAAASRKTAARMASIGFTASIAQAVTAIALAYGALGLFSLTGRAVVGLAEQVLAPLSAAAVALVGLWILWRGVRGLRALRQHERRSHGHSHSHGHDHDHAGHHHSAHHDHHHGCAGGCRHGPTAQEAEQAETWGDTAALILSIGARPCSGALIVLAIAWNFQLYWAGALSALAMGAGTGLVVGGVALAATSLRDAQALRDDDGTSRRLFAWVQIAAGVTVAALSGLFAAAMVMA